jgi:hypothetical protein
VGRKNIFKPTIGKENLHQDSNDNGVRIVNFTTFKNLVVKSTMSPHRIIHKWEVVVRTVLGCLRIGIGGGRL